MTIAEQIVRAKEYYDEVYDAGYQKGSSEGVDETIIEAMLDEIIAEQEEIIATQENILGIKRFYFEGAPWKFAEGMTWEDFTNSEYNVGGVFHFVGFSALLYRGIDGVRFVLKQYTHPAFGVLTEICDREDEITANGTYILGGAFES